MQTEQAINAIFSLIFVICLIGICAFIAKKIAIDKKFFHSNSARRLKIIEQLNLDARRKIIIVEKDDKEEIVILLGNSSETIISTTPKKK